MLELRTDISDRGEQKVWLNMTDSRIDTQLRAIAKHTLNGPLTETDLNNFVNGVRAGIQRFVARAYGGLNISFVSAAGPEVHEIRFDGGDRCGLFGESPGDWLNRRKAEVSLIYVGTFKCVFVDDGKLLTETPARRTDSLAVRIEDTATAIGRTAAHELGHSLGLTGDGSSMLHGCDGWHNCDEYDRSNPADRFDNGHYIMDPGPKSRLYARIGQENATRRSAKVPRFNDYNRSYLELIH